MKNAIVQHQSFLTLGCIIIITFLTYKNVLNNGFIEFWDDNVHVTQNEDIRSMSPGNLKKMFTSSYVAMYQPLTEISYALDYLIWELNPFGYHLTNLLLHLIAVIIVYFIVQTLGFSPIQSGLVTILFATTSLTTEPVAWISARSTLLSGAFIFAGLLIYIQYLLKDKKVYLILSLALYAIALFTRITVVVFPFLLILVDIFLKKSWLSRKFLLNKIPFLLISIPIVWIGMRYRVLNETSADAPNLIKFFVPRILYYMDHWLSVHGLAATSEWPPLLSLQHLSALAFLVLILLALRFTQLNTKVVLFGLLFFITALGPYLLYSEKTNPVADRYGYIPLFGIYFIVGTILFEMYTSNIVPQKILASLLFVFLLSSNVIASSKYTIIWKDDFSLWYHASQVQPNRGHNRFKLGLAYIRNNQFREAETEFMKAIELDSLDYFTLFNLGGLKHETKKYQEAKVFYSEAIKLEPSVHLFYTGRAKTYIVLREFSNAIQDLNKSISLLEKPEADLYYLRGISKIETGDPPCTDLNIALKLGTAAALSKVIKHCR